jgi:phage I-like protein
MTPLNKPVVRKTRDTLGWGYGCDTGRNLVITITPSSEGDTITLRPHGTRRSETVRIEDVYHWAIRSRCQQAALVKARAKKAALAVKREAAELKRRINRIGK